jgi:hypothetical protein
MLFIRSFLFFVFVSFFGFNFMLSPQANAQNSIRSANSARTSRTTPATGSQVSTAPLHPRLEAGFRIRQEALRLLPSLVTSLGESESKELIEAAILTAEGRINIIDSNTEGGKDSKTKAATGTQKIQEAAEKIKPLEDNADKSAEINYLTKLVKAVNSNSSPQFYTSLKKEGLEIFSQENYNQLSPFLLFYELGLNKASAWQVSTSSLTKISQQEAEIFAGSGAVPFVLLSTERIFQERKGKSSVYRDLLNKNYHYPHVIAYSVIEVSKDFDLKEAEKQSEYNEARKMISSENMGGTISLARLDKLITSLGGKIPKTLEKEKECKCPRL